MTVTPNPLNSLLKIQGDGSSRYGQVPKFSMILGDHVEAAITAHLIASDKKLADIESKADDITLCDLIAQLDDLDDELDIQWGAVKHLNSVKTNDDLRSAIEKMEPRMTEFSLKVSQSEPIYNAMIRVQSDAKTDAQIRIMELGIRARKLSGIGLPEDKSKRFNEIAMQLSALSTKFGNNTIDGTKKWNKLVTDKDALVGIPERVFEEFAEKAKKEGHETATAENGPWMLTVDANAYLPVIQFCENRSIREEVYKARISIAGPEDTDNSNVSVISDILKLKIESAEILGFKNHAEKSCSSKMATPESARALLEDLLSKSLDMAKKEHVELQEYATKHGFQGELNHWDISFWAERMKLELYDFNEELLRPYFKLEYVMDGLFSVLKRLFNIKVEKFAIPDMTQWDPAVDLYEIKQDGVTISYFFVDPYGRPGEKNGGAWMNEVCSRSKLVNDRIPIAHIVLNNSPPTATTPSLLNWREVETAFHEMGHALQHMLTKVDEPSVSGIRGVEWDVVELPSQFMENWVFQYDVLSTFAKHYETGEVLPRELFDKVERAKNYRAASFIVRQLRFGLMDFILHSEYDPRTSDKTPFDIDREVATRTSVLAPYPGDYFLCSFGHIFAGGYSAGYFSYLWAEVMSADAFAAFEESGLVNEEALVKLGEKFRNTVLALGGSKHPADVYSMYRGKAATVDALLKHKGLVQ